MGRSKHSGPHTKEDMPRYKGKSLWQKSDEILEKELPKAKALWKRRRDAAAKGAAQIKKERENDPRRKASPKTKDKKRKK